MNMCVPELKSSVSFCQALSSLNEVDYLTHYIGVHGSLQGYDTHKCLNMRVWHWKVSDLLC